MRRNRGFLLDMDGTLIDSEKIFRKLWKQAANHYGFPLSDYDLRLIASLNQSNLEKKVKSILPKGVSFEEFQKYRKDAFNEFIKIKGVSAKKGVKQFLAFCKENKINCIVVTNTSTQQALKRLESAKLLPFIKEMIGGDQVPEKKPNPSGYLLGIKRLGISKEDCIAIEDSHNGILAATSAGIKTIWIKDVWEVEEEVQNKAILKLSSFFDVLKEIEKV